MKRSSRNFSCPQVKQNSRQYLLLREDILQKTVVGYPWHMKLKAEISDIGLHHEDEVAHWGYVLFKSNLMTRFFWFSIDRGLRSIFQWWNSVCFLLTAKVELPEKDISLKIPRELLFWPWLNLFLLLVEDMAYYLMTFVLILFL